MNLHWILTTACGLMVSIQEKGKNIARKTVICSATKPYSSMGYHEFCYALCPFCPFCHTHLKIIYNRNSYTKQK